LRSVPAHPQPNGGGAPRQLAFGLMDEAAVRRGGIYSERLLIASSLTRTTAWLDASHGRGERRRSRRGRSGHRKARSATPGSRRRQSGRADHIGGSIPRRRCPGHGSTSLAVVRYAPCPVAIVRGRPRPVRHVLVPVDGSGGSRAALRFLSSFQLLRDTRVSLLHVLPRPAVLGLHRLFTSLPDQRRGEDRRTQQANAEEVLAGAAAVLAEARWLVERLVVDGDPAQEIVSIARRRDVDLLVIGSRGLGTIGRFLLGSVSETVLHHAGRPVVIARAR
jgi:nucleotide-binding universal stress UspA family protein